MKHFNVNKDFILNLLNFFNLSYTFSSSKLTVVHFSAEWADQCGQVTEVLQELSKLPEIQSGGSSFGLCDAENLSEISLKYKV